MSSAFPNRDPPSPEPEPKIALRWRHAPDFKKRFIRPEGVFGKTCMTVHIIFVFGDTEGAEDTRYNIMLNVHFLSAAGHEHTKSDQ